MNLENIEGLECTDHITYCIEYDRKDEFMSYWAENNGLAPSQAIRTTLYPAEHIALVPNPDDHRGCDQMIGLSISKDPKSPINKLLQHGHRHASGGVFQHRAYLVKEGYSIENIKDNLEKIGMGFMTPILSYTDDQNATLKQIFTECKNPYGPFIEIIERRLGLDGKPFRNFNASQIDNLYDHYDTLSKNLKLQRNACLVYYKKQRPNHSYQKLSNGARISSLLDFNSASKISMLITKFLQVGYVNLPVFYPKHF